MGRELIPNGGVMTLWPLVEFISRFLIRDEREAVLGDLIEAHESPWRALLGVSGLLLRRQLLLWKSWRPWLAGFGVAFPSSFLLMGLSLTVSWSYQRLLCPNLLAAASLTHASGLLLLISQALVLTGWAWTGGFVVGSISSRTIWMTSALCYAPCLFCLGRFRVESLSRFCLLLFLLPAIWGVRKGLRISRIKLGWAAALALGLTVFTVPAWSGRSGAWNLNWFLNLPAWYLVLAAFRAHWQERTRHAR